MIKVKIVKGPEKLPAGPAARPGVYRSRKEPVFARRSVQIGVGVTLAFLLVVTFVVGRRSASMKVTNLAPHAQWFAVARPTFPGRWETEGWHYLGAGQSETVERTFWLVKPAFYVAARSADSEVIRYLYGDDEVAFEGAGTTLERMVIDDVTMRFETDSAGVRPDGEGRYPWSAYPAEFACAFQPKDGSAFAFTVVDPYFPHLSLAPEDNPSDLRVAALEAGRLGESLRRQARFASTWEGKPFPFDLGARFEDPNSFAHFGIEVAAAVALTRDEYPMPLVPGDTLIEFAGHHVYSPYDVLALLYEHATDVDRGVEVAIDLVVRRDGLPKRERITYFFERNYWQRNDADAVISGWLGLSDAVSLGHGAAANAVGIKVLSGASNLLNWFASKIDPKYEPKYVKTPEYKKLRWAIVQNQARLRQFESGAYNLGAFAGFFVQPTRSLARPFLGRSGRILTQSAAGRVAWEVGESAVWTASDGSPLRRPEELREELRTVVPFAAAGGVIQGTLRLVRR